jgi:two-component system cell cycle sensor histidine kinase/response regulator CckA
MIAGRIPMTSGRKTKPSPTVLVVDDDAAIRQIARRFLEAEGYQVTEASDGLEAIARLRHGTPPDVLMVDFRMPEVNGDELVRHIRDGSSDFKVLYVTGHVDALLDEHPTLREWEAFLEKPFTAIGLLEAVSLLLYGTLTGAPA